MVSLVLLGLVVSCVWGVVGLVCQYSSQVIGWKDSSLK